MSEPNQGHGPSQELVTGATGLVGMERLAYRLKRGWPTVALRRKDSDVGRVEGVLRERLGAEFDSAWDSLQWRESDLSDVGGLEAAMEGCVRVFHAAGRVSFQPGDEAALKAVNVVGTANVVNAALATGVRRLFHISSVSALGRSTKDPDTGLLLPVVETADWSEGAGATPYGVSKHAAEMEVWRGVAEGLEAIVVNPTVILGDARYGESSGMVYRRAVQGRRHYPVGGGGFVGVADLLEVCAALDAAADSGREGVLGERFIVSAEDVSHRDVMTWVANEAGVAGPKRPLKGWMLSLAWRSAAFWSWVTGTEPLLTRDLANNTLVTHRYDTTKLFDVLPGHEFTSIRDVIRQSMAGGKG